MAELDSELETAIINGNSAAVKSFLDKHSDDSVAVLKSKDRSGNTPLILAAIYHGKRDKHKLVIVQIILSEARRVFTEEGYINYLDTENHGKRSAFSHVPHTEEARALFYKDYDEVVPRKVKLVPVRCAIPVVSPKPTTSEKILSTGTDSVLCSDSDDELGKHDPKRRLGFLVEYYRIRQGGREGKNIPRSKLAERISAEGDVPPSRIMHIERGATLSDENIIDKIAVALNLSDDEKKLLLATRMKAVQYLQEHANAWSAGGAPTTSHER